MFSLENRVFAACPVCKAIGCDRGLCSFCAEALWLRHEPITRRERGYTVRSLFSWRKDGWQGLNWWVMSLKRKEHPVFWREPALWALEAFSTGAARPTLVPIPSRGANHALGFARELARNTGWPLRLPLVLPEDGPQKRRSREKRQERYYDSDGSKFTDVVIVDDIVTTGATARAAYLALGRPRNCEVWCLLDRRPCGTAAPLL